MSHRIRSLAAGLALALAAAPLAASAQTSQAYSPPKVIKQGSSSSAVAGTGSVTLQVLVAPNGAVKSAKVEKSTNHGDDTAALEIAKSSSYKPGRRDGKPGLFFYTMVLKFNGSAVATEGVNGDDTSAALTLIRAGKYADAKAQLQTYLGGHPGDTQAQTLLGVADQFLGDSTGAATAFESAGTIPPAYKNVAALAYGNAASAAIDAKHYDQAITLATKLDALQHSVNALYLRATAEANLQQYQKSTDDFQAARDLEAQSPKPDPANAAKIDASLAKVYFLSGQGEKGVALAERVRAQDAAAAAQLDPEIANYYAASGETAQKAGRTADAVAAYEKAARAVPSQAGSLYIRAANALSASAKTPDDWRAVKAESDKALAAAPNNAVAEYVGAVALANAGDRAGAKTLLQKAKADAGADVQLNADIDKALGQVGH